MFRELVGADKPDVVRFTNDDVKRITAGTQFKNPFDATKFDQSRLLPQLLLDANYCVIHLGKGDHAFVRARNQVYCPLSEPSKVLDWPCRMSPLNGIESSEAWLFSFTFNHRIIHHYLWGVVSENPMIFTQKRANYPVSFKIGHIELSSPRLQFEMDGCLYLESRNEVVVFEVKNGERTDFNSCQLYFPFRYFRYLQGVGTLDIRLHIRLVDAVRNVRRGWIDFHEFRFAEEVDLSSIELVSNGRYILMRV